jgi:hypothetical protein
VLVVISEAAGAMVATVEYMKPKTIGKLLTAHLLLAPSPRGSSVTTCATMAFTTAEKKVTVAYSEAKATISDA